MATPAFTTPSSLPSPSSDPSLSEKINIATRPIHSQLNRLIIARLPLALPPCTTNPSVYISGLLHIAPIYITFESAWQSILDIPKPPKTLTQRLAPDGCDPDGPILDSRSIPIIQNTETPTHDHAPEICSRTHSLLSHLRLPGLLRSGRLREDLRILTGTPEYRIDEALQLVAQKGRLAAFIAHTKRSVNANPHVLLAYSWILYMALFSGGRYLRALLQGAGGFGHDFWERDPSPVRPYSFTTHLSDRRESRSFELGDPRSTRPRSRPRSEGSNSTVTPGLQFFNFPGEVDGEDIKVEFKKRITEVEISLTDNEKEEIISEAEIIFEFMVEIVEELDKAMGKNEDDSEAKRKATTPKTSNDGSYVKQERRPRKVGSSRDACVKEDSVLLDLLVTAPRAKNMEATSKNAEGPSDEQSEKDVHHLHNYKRLALSPVISKNPQDVCRVRIMAHRYVLSAVAMVAVLLLWCLY